MDTFSLGRWLGQIEARLTHMEREVRELKRSRGKPPRIETVIKRALTWGLPMGTLWATGSLEKAAEVLAIMAGR